MELHSECSDELSTARMDAAKEIEEDLKIFKQRLIQLSSQIGRSLETAKKLRDESKSNLRIGEMSQRLIGNPAAYNYDFSLPFEYLHGIAEKYEKNLVAYQKQVDELEKFIQSHRGGVITREGSAFCLEFDQNFQSLDWLKFASVPR